MAALLGYLLIRFQRAGTLSTLAVPLVCIEPVEERLYRGRDPHPQVATED